MAPLERRRVRAPATDQQQTPAAGSLLTQRCPNTEWMLMCRVGLSRGHIAELACSSPSTVACHLRAAWVAPGTRHGTRKGSGSENNPGHISGTGPGYERTDRGSAGDGPVSQYAPDLSRPWRPDRCSEAHAGTLRYRDGVPGRRAGRSRGTSSPRRRPQDLAGTLNRTAKHHPSTAGGRERDAKQKLRHELVLRFKANGRMFR